MILLFKVDFYRLMSRKWTCPTRIHLNNRELHKNVKKSPILKAEIKEKILTEKTSDLGAYLVTDHQLPKLVQCDK